MPSIVAPILEHMCVLLSDFGIGSPWGRHLARVRVRYREVTKAEVTPMLLIPWRAEVRAHVRLWIWFTFHVLDRIKYRVRVMVRVMATVSVRSQGSLHPCCFKWKDFILFDG